MQKVLQIDSFVIDVLFDAVCSQCTYEVPG